MGRIFKLFNRCKHNHIKFIENIHGDRINFYKGYRSLWLCKDCRKVFKNEVLILNKENDVSKALKSKMKKTVYVR